ncbi:MAG TPA: hypothetical protein VHD55_01850 [Candidatus Paceibacterota bacterium]|nr:hypothetical protein [Candidatus Paceibacterota bacterium]
MPIRPEASGRIRITKVPDGEAPLEVRQAWVGLELPCGPICGYGDEPPKGVLSNEPIKKNMYGFDVPQREALEILEASSPEAAAWWRTHGFPEGNDYFVFDRHWAEIISGVTMQEITVWDNMETGRYQPVFTYTPP